MHLFTLKALKYCNRQANAIYIYRCHGSQLFCTMIRNISCCIAEQLSIGITSRNGDIISGSGTYMYRDFIIVVYLLCVQINRDQGISMHTCDPLNHIKATEQNQIMILRWIVWPIWNCHWTNDWWIDKIKRKLACFFVIYMREKKDTF